MERRDLAGVVAQHHGAIYRYAFRLTGCTADAEDLTQQVFLVVQQKVEQVRDVESMRSWLYAVLRTCFLKRRRRPEPLTLGAADVDVVSEPAGVVDLPIDRMALQDALDSLPDMFRVVILMFYFEHCTYQEIAEKLGIPPGTVMSRLSRAKSHLRRRLLSGTEQLDNRPVRVASSPAGQP